MFIQHNRSQARIKEESCGRSTATGAKLASPLNMDPYDIHFEGRAPRHALHQHPSVVSNE